MCAHLTHTSLEWSTRESFCKNNVRLFNTHPPFASISLPASFAVSHRILHRTPSLIPCHSTLTRNQQKRPNGESLAPAYLTKAHHGRNLPHRQQRSDRNVCHPLRLAGGLRAASQAINFSLGHRNPSAADGWPPSLSKQCRAGGPRSCESSALGPPLGRGFGRPKESAQLDFSAAPPPAALYIAATALVVMGLAVGEFALLSRAS
jgi:hypothetical protein